MNKIVVYTGAFGKNYGMLPQKKIEGVDFFCFTDDKKKIKSPWKPISLLESNLDEGRQNRHPKLMPHLYFKDYEISIYIDSNVLIVGDLQEIIENLGDFKMAIFDHNQSRDKRNCVYDEHEAILNLGREKGVFKDNLTVMKNQINFLKKENYPKKNGLIFSAVLIRRHNNQKVIKVMETWWHILSTRSKRDQLSFNYAAWKNNFVPTIINGDLRKGNKYFYFLTKARRYYIPKLIVYRLKKKLRVQKHP
jgi:hypothetical protein